MMAQKLSFVNIIPAWEFVPFNSYDAQRINFVPGTNNYLFWIDTPGTGL